MSGAHRSEHERAAEKAVDAIEGAARVGRQLGLFEALRPVEERKRGGNRASSALSAWLAAQGYQSPAEALMRHAGLHLDRPAEIKAMTTVDMIEVWATRGECGEDGTVLRFSPEMRAGLFGTVMAEMRKATEALMPYVAKKLSPDVAVSTTQQLVIGMPGGSAQAAFTPRGWAEKKALENQCVDAADPAMSDEQVSDG